MTRDDIIRMAREADINLSTIEYYQRELEHFAALVAAAEREECAGVCEDGVQNATDWDSSFWDQACENRAVAIRARGEQK